MLDVVVVVNNFLHDFASGIWLATLLVLYLLYRFTVGADARLPDGQVSVRPNQEGADTDNSSPTSTVIARSPAELRRGNEAISPEIATLPEPALSRVEGVARNDIKVLQRIFDIIFILFLASLAIIILTGVVRLLTYDYYTTRVVTVTFGLTKRSLLIGKHILLIAIYGTGTWFTFHLRHQIGPQK